VERQKVRPNLYLPEPWPKSLAQWRDNDSILDLSSFGSQRIPAELLAMLLDDDRRVGAFDCSHSVLGRMLWDGCEFTEDAAFDRAVFGGELDLRGCCFRGRAGFSGARFQGPTYLHGASFERSANFQSAEFAEEANFEEATFAQTPDFSEVSFAEVRFDEATFSIGARFNAAVFGSNASFNRCVVGGDLSFDRAVFAGEAHFDGARLSGDVSFDAVSAEELSLTRTTFNGTSHEVLVTSTTDPPPGSLPDVALWLLRARIESDTVIVLGQHCSLDAARVVARAPVTIVAERPDRAGALTSVKEADITAPFRVGRHVDLSGTDWGDHDLTKISLAGTDTLPRTGLAYAALRSPRAPSWTTGLAAGRRALPTESTASSTTELQTLERNYRDLRRQLEADGNTHGANDFYFGEMEARRRQLPLRSPRRWLLETYRMVSGYGTSIWPAIVTWQVLVLVATRLLLVGGINITEDRSYQRGEVWRFALEGSLSLFRPTNAPLLSVPETIIMVALRILGPLLLALAAISVRNQTKR